jgi:hypothetical protein
VLSSIEGRTATVTEKMSRQPGVHSWLQCCRAAVAMAAVIFFSLQRQTQNLIDSNVADFDDENKSTYMLLYCSLHCLATQSIQ